MDLPPLPPLPPAPPLPAGPLRPPAPAAALAQPQWASVYADARNLCVQTCSGFDRCAHDPAGSTVFTTLDAGPVVAGQAVLQALASSRILRGAEAGHFFDPGVLAQGYEAWVAQLQERFGAGSRPALFTGLRHCVVTRAGGSIRLRPTRHDPLNAENWTAEGMAPELAVLVPADASLEAVGRALLLALERCA